MSDKWNIILPLLNDLDGAIPMIEKRKVKTQTPEQKQKALDKAEAKRKRRLERNLRNYNHE